MREVLTPRRVHAASTAALYTAGPSLAHHVVFAEDASARQAARAEAEFILYGWLKFAMTVPLDGSPCCRRRVTLGERNESPAAMAAAAVSCISGRKYCM